MMTYQLKRWTQHGHDRLYVNAGHSKVGWIDLKTGRSTSTTKEGWPSPVAGMVQQWLASNGLGHLRVALAPRKRGDEITTQEFLDRLDRERSGQVTDDRTGGSAVDATGTWPRRQEGRVAHGRDLAKNKPGSSARATAREHSTWWRQIGAAMGMRTKDQAWRIGAEGEEIVAHTLSWARLRGWRVLHAVPVGNRGSDIDHVLIGPAGVITVNTKNHRGQYVRVKHDIVFIGKTAKKYGQVSQHEAARASRLLTAAAGRHVPVRAVVVIVGAKRLRGSRSAGVDFMTKSNLLLTLLFQRRILSQTEVDGLYEIARRSTTWQPGS